MGKIYQGKLVVERKKFAIVVSRFNEFLTSRLLTGCIDTLLRHGAEDDNIATYWVPGSFEIPLVTKKIAVSNKFNGIICLGVIVQGDTPHYEYIAQEVTKGIAQVMLESGIPISFGILTTDDLTQAIERAGTKAGNKGSQAAESIIEMVNLIDQLE